MIHVAYDSLRTNEHSETKKSYKNFLRNFYPFDPCAGMTSALREKKEKQILISVILIVATFTLCNSFESILFILAHQGCLSSLDIFWDYLRPTANFLMVLNSSVNSLIFGICSKAFRTKFVDVFCKCCKKTSGKTVHKPGVFSYNKETDTTSLTFPDGRTVTLIEPKHI